MLYENCAALRVDLRIIFLVSLRAVAIFIGRIEPPPPVRPRPTVRRVYPRARVSCLPYRRKAGRARYMVVWNFCARPQASRRIDAPLVKGTAKRGKRVFGAERKRLPPSRPLAAPYPHEEVREHPNGG